MANNLIQVKRTSVSGRAANSTTLPNPGELALNMTDGILYSTNGSAVFEVGANNTNAKVSNTLTVGNSTVGFTANSTVLKIQNGSTFMANGALGSNNQALISNGSGVHWADRPPVAEDTQMTGFLDGNTETSISFDGTNTFTLTDTGSGWSIYLNGKKYHFTGNRTVDLTASPPAAAGRYYVTVDSTGNLTVTTTPFDYSDPAKTPVAFVRWDNAATPKWWLTDERHTVLLTLRHRWNLHNTVGLRLQTFGNLTYNLNGTTTANNLVSVGQSVIAHEDMIKTLSPLTPNTTGAGVNNYVHFYRTATGPDVWTWKYSDMPFLYNTAIQYDNNATLSSGSNNKYYNSYIIYSTYQGAARYLVVPGRGEFGTIDAAQAEDITGWDWSAVQGVELFFAWQLTWLCLNSNPQSGQVSLTAVRKVGIAPAAAVSSAANPIHNQLTGLQGGDGSNEFYHLNSATYSAVTGSSILGLSAGDGLGTNSTTFYVKANTGIVSNSSGVFVNTAYIDTLGAATLGGVNAANYVQNTDSRILSGNLQFTGANNVFSDRLVVNATVINSSGITTSAITGNLTGNVAATTISGNLTGNVTAISISGNLTGNVVAGTVNATTINATSSIVVGANVLVNTSVVQVGNSTVRTVVNTTAFTGNVVATTISGNLTGNVAATTITGNLTGNVAAITITGNLTGNVVATTISGNLTGNVAATTLTGNLTGNVVATTISGNLTGNVVATNVNAATVQVNSSITLDTDRNLRFKTVNTAAFTYFVHQADDNFVLYTTNTTYGQRPVFSIFANSNTSSLSFSTPVIFNTNVNLGSATVIANGNVGTTGQVLTSNGSATYWSTPTAVATINTAAQYNWTNTHTFSANVSFTGNGIGIASDTGAIYLGGISDANWKIARNSGVVTKWKYTNNTIDIVTANSNLEGMTIGLVNGNSYFETGYLGTFIASNVTVGNSTSNVFVNSTAFVGNVVATSVSGNLIGNVSGTHFGNVVATTVSGNLTGNVAAVTITGNLTGNVIATTISGNLTGNVAATTITGNLTGNVVAGTVNATTINATSSIVVGANVLVNTSVLQIGNSTVKTTVNSTAFIGNVVATTISGNLTGNVVATTISGNLTGNVSATTISGNLTAITANVINKLQIGTPGSFDFGSNAVIEVDANGNTYVQSVLQNANTGNNASTDMVLTNDTGNDSVGYVDLGINGSNYNQPGFSITGAGDAYLYTANGHLAIGTASDKEVILHAGGTTSDKRMVTVNSTAVILANAAALVANGSKGTAAQILTSNGTGVYWSSSANNADNLGGVAAASYQLNSTLNANIASYLPTYTGTVNAATFQVDTAFKANTTDVVTANLTVQGNLIVTGTTVTLNTATLDVKDLNITLAKGTATAAAANGAGITVDVANAEIVYINAGNTWLSNIGFAVGNSTSNVSINSTAFIGNVVATRVTANLTGNVTATTITGNLTGNVAATTITGNLTGNVVATTISGNLTGNVAAVTISGNLTGNVVATTISGNLTGNVVAGTVNATTINATSSIVVGANVNVNTSTLSIGNSTANVFVNSTSFVGNVVATTISGNLTGNVAAVTITGNLTGNVIATTISGNLTGNVVAVTVNATGNGYFAGNVGIGAAPSSIVGLYHSRSWATNADVYGSQQAIFDTNTAMTAARTKYNATNLFYNYNQNKSSDGLTTYNSTYFGSYNAMYNGNPSTGGDASTSLMTGIFNYVANYANGASANTLTTARGTFSQIAQFGTGVMSSAEGSRSRVLVGNSSVANITAAYGYYSDIFPNTSGPTIGTGYLYFGNYVATGGVTTRYGIGITNESYNYFQGNVAISASNTTPAHKLRVDGTTSLAGAVSDITTLAAGNTTITGFINATSTITTSGGAGSIQLTNATSNWITWQTNAGVGAPTTTTSSAGTKLILYPSVTATSVDYAIGIEGNHMWFSSWSSASAGFKWYANTTNFMTANVAGLTHTGTITAVDFNSTSDIRFKSDIVVIDSALDKVNQLNGYTFTMNETGERSTGLIAQEVEKVLPEAVKGDDKKTLSYGNMVGLLVEAIKEQNAKIERLEAVINNLKK